MVHLIYNFSTVYNISIQRPPFEDLQCRKFWDWGTSEIFI